MNIKAVEKAIRKQTIKARSHWGRGVAKYALDIIKDIEERGITDIALNSRLAEICLNGAENWRQYSEGGCSLISDSDIAARLCAPYEISKYYHGNPCGKRPNAMEATWIETQTRALTQAGALICDTLDKLENPPRVIDRTNAA